MGDRAGHLRDRTLVLRILVPSLQAALRDKMSALEEAAAQRQADSAKSGSSAAAAEADRLGLVHAVSGPGRTPAAQVLDLDGVSCEPSSDGSTLWSFRCDGASYPARLVNLPCPVELHKTHDHATYYKCADVGQILIVYEDEMHMEEAESVPGYRTEGYPSYYHSGLTPPMKRVVERRFAAREHRSVAPPRSEVAAVERELRELIDTITKDAKGKSKGSGQSGPQHGGRVLEEVVEDVVEYEPWMDDNGRVPYGVEFDEKDVMCTKHPEVWLSPDDVKEEERLREEQAKKAAEEVAAAPAVAAAAPKVKAKKKDAAAAGVASTGEPGGGAATKKKKKKKKSDSESKKPSSPTPDGHKKGIAAKKTREVDEVTQVATQIAKGLDNDEDAVLQDLDDFFDFSAEGDDTFAGMDL